MKIFVLAAAFFAAIISADYNQPKGTSVMTAQQEAKTDNMKQYWLVMLYKGPNRMHTTADAEKIQQAHLANINRLSEKGSIIMAGPMGYDKDMRGMFIMDGKDSAQIAGYIKSDSAVITGRLRFEIHPWWVQKGNYQFK